MANVEIKLNSAGVLSLLKSPEMMAICEGYAKAAQRRCGDGYQTDTYTGKTRVNAMIWADTDEARKDNSANNTILKALKG